MDDERPDFVKTNRNTVWINRNELEDFYRRLPLPEKFKATEKYKVVCQECDFEREVTGSKFKAIGHLSEHRINDCPVNEPHNMKVIDVSVPSI